jgi:hypothetical protein
MKSGNGDRMTRPLLHTWQANSKTRSHCRTAGQFVTLRDAADYITKLGKATQQSDEWQTAVRCLIGAAEGRDFLMHARIGMPRALNRSK